MLRGPYAWLKTLEAAIWAPRTAREPDRRRLVLRAVRLVSVLFRDVFHGELTLWTMSLVYTTLLSMVPLLALSFSVLKAFGVHNQLEPLLHNLLLPLGAEGQVITDRLVGFIARMNVGVLGVVGLLLLVYTVISLMQKIEESFNAIWHITQLRSLGERFSRYLSAVLVGPILVFAALGITATALNSDVAQRLLAIEPFGDLVPTVSKLVPYALVIAAFTFLYRFVPNTRVGFVPALAAGVIGGVLWQSAGWAFAAFVTTSTRYSAIYSSFAVLVLFLIWLYVSWLVLLIGASVAFYLQHPEYLYAMPGEPRLSNRMRERLALAIVHAIATDFVRGNAPWTLHRLTQQLGVPMYAVNAVCDALVQGKLLRQSNDDPPAYLPGRDIAEVPVAEVLATARRAGEDRFLNPQSIPLAPHVENLVKGIEAATAAATEGISLRSIVEEPEANDRSHRHEPAATPDAPRRD